MLTHCYLYQKPASTDEENAALHIYLLQVVKCGPCMLTFTRIRYGTNRIADCIF